MGSPCRLKQAGLGCFVEGLYAAHHHDVLVQDLGPNHSYQTCPNQWCLVELHLITTLLKALHLIEKNKRAGLPF